MIGAWVEIYTHRGMRSQIVKGSGGSVKLTQATKDTKVIICRREPKQHFKWSFILKDSYGKQVIGVSIRKKGLDPKFWWKISLKERSA